MTTPGTGGEDADLEWEQCIATPDVCGGWTPSWLREETWSCRGRFIVVYVHCS